MYTKWTSHCKTEQEKAQFEADVRRAKVVLDRLKQMIEQQEELLTNQELSSAIFASPAWPYHQASLVGARSALKDLKRLIDLDKQKDTTNE